MKETSLKKLGKLVLAAFMVAGVGFVSAGKVEAQTRRVVIVRPYSYRLYNPYGFGYRSWWGYPYGYSRWDPRSPYYEYRQYVFSNSESAVTNGYNQGFKTGRDDGKKAKSFNPQRSHYYQEAGFGNFGEVYRSGFNRGYQVGYRAGMNERAG